MSSNTLKHIFSLHKKVGRVSFSDVVASSCNYKIIPIDIKSPQDEKLLKYLSDALNNFLKLTDKTKSRFTGERINDVGKNLENLIVEEIRKKRLKVNRLTSSGYPDLEIRQKRRVTFLEIKTTGNTRKNKTQHRMFYFSSGKKITSDGRHLLLQIQMEEESDKYWKVVSWEIRDLSKLRVILKTEFNASFRDFERTPLLKASNT